MELNGLVTHVFEWLRYLLESPQKVFILPKLRNQIPHMYFLHLTLPGKPNL